jgi:hypothetical protein
MNAYWGRLVSVSAFILSLLFVQIWRISATPGGPDGGDIVVTAAIVPITAALIVLVYWARAQPARDRRRSLAGRDELTWLADVKVDQPSMHVHLPWCSTVENSS